MRKCNYATINRGTGWHRQCAARLELWADLPEAGRKLLVTTAEMLSGQPPLQDGKPAEREKPKKNPRLPEAHTRGSRGLTKGDQRLDHKRTDTGKQRKNPTARREKQSVNQSGGFATRASYTHEYGKAKKSPDCPPRQSGSLQTTETMINARTRAD
jgi:hypothetical protein